MFSAFFLSTRTRINDVEGQKKYVDCFGIPIFFANFAAEMHM